MRLLKFNALGELEFTKDLIDGIPPYAILSHTWGKDEEEVTFDDLQNDRGKNKAGYIKLEFCVEQARKDQLEYFWVDTCCINKANHTELSEAITSMFRWYQNAAKCYVYLSDVSTPSNSGSQSQSEWDTKFRQSKWFTRGWTLQELLAPRSVEFFSQGQQVLGTKQTLEQIIHEITGIPQRALQRVPTSQFTVDERLRWAERRTTTKVEDRAYCLLGIFDIFMPIIYGEGDNAFRRLKEEIGGRSIYEYIDNDPSSLTKSFLMYSKVVLCTSALY
jgi:hypothetical protein